jgi:hypothetical protein
MEYGILPTLNKDFILSKITSEQIFEYYLQIKVQTNILYKAPPVIRVGDNNPTCSFYYSYNGKLRFQDFAGYFHGDCFDVVGYILKVNSNDKKGFSIILDQIARDFKLHKYQNKNHITSGNTFDVREVAKVKVKPLIEFQKRNWTKSDADFWLAGNINSKLLTYGRVFPCQYIWLNNNLIYNFNPKDPAYAYFFKEKEIKIYYPNRKEYRFLGNTSYIQGLDILKPDQIGIVTKSYKDVLSLKSFGIQAIAPSSETNLISLEDWYNIKYYCNHWFSLLDYDRTGIKMAIKLKKLYNITPLFFYNYKPINKEGKFTGSTIIKDFQSFTNVKDFYDYVKYYGKDNTFNLINKVKDKYEDLFIKFDEEMYNNLNWLKKDKLNTKNYEIPF